MSVDVDAEFIIGWMVEYDDAENYGEMAEYDFEQLESIPEVGEYNGPYWVWSTNAYMNRPPIAIGWRVPFRKSDPDGANEWSTVPLSVTEFAANLADESKLETARKVYKAVCGKAPDTDPLPLLFERWW